MTVEIHEAKAQLLKLIARAVKGEACVITKAGKPLVKVTAVDAPRSPQRLGFLAGEIAVPEDFNRRGQTRSQPRSLRRVRCAHRRGFWCAQRTLRANRLRRRSLER